MFATAQVARSALERQGLNYFVIDTNAAFFDLLPYSPLFSAGEIHDHLAIAWQANGVYLLTWPSSATMPIDSKFDEGYLRSKELALKFPDFPAIYGQLRAIYDQWSRRWPVQLDPTKPRPRGWQ